MTPLALSIIGLSIVLQMLAAVQALRLIRVTGWRAAWSMFAIALLLMAGRRAVSLGHMVMDDHPIDLMPELMALAISALMLVGVQRISTLLRGWNASRRRDEILRRAQNEFIATPGPDHAAAFHRLADDLTRHCGWDGMVIGLLQKDGSPHPLGSGGPRFPAVSGEDLLAAAMKAIGDETAAGTVEMAEVPLDGGDAVAFPVVSGTEMVGLMVFVRSRDRRSDCRIDGMNSVVLAVGGMIGAVRSQYQREQADRDQRALIAELERSNQELEQFAYISSHDMQEPLRMVILYLELLQRQYDAALDDTAREYVGFAVEGAQRMHAMILDLLKYCRLGRGDESAHPMADAQAALESAARSLAARDFTLTVPEAKPVVAMRPEELERVFLNLLSNAVKFHAADRVPEIAVTAEAEDGGWHFRVADNGIGIDPAYFDKIFQVFQRLHPRCEYEGTGIGLAFVKKAVERRGGKVWVESTPGQGSVFHFTLPAL